MYAPPTRSSSCTDSSPSNQENLDSNTFQTAEQGAFEGDGKSRRCISDGNWATSTGADSNRKELGAWGDLATVIESPDARNGAGLFFGNDDHPQDAHPSNCVRKRIECEQPIVPFSFVNGGSKDSATRPSTGMSLASTTLQSR